MANILSSINKFYHLERTSYNKSLERSRRNANVINSFLDTHCGNEDGILRAIFRIGQSISVIPNDLDFAVRSDYPREVNVVLESLHRQFPASPGYRSAEEALHNIVSRYSQFGGELDATVDSIISEVNDLRASVQDSRQKLHQVSKSVDSASSSDA